MSLAMTKSTMNALAESLIPAHITPQDPDYLGYARLLAKERRTRS
jgi:hypothetical protein